MPAAGTSSRTLAFRLTRHFDVPREQVFDAWTTPELLKRWWCPAGWLPQQINVDLRPGGSYRFVMQDVSGTTVVAIHGQFVDVRRPERLSYTWNWQNAFDGMPETFVTVEFHSVAAGTDVVVVHDRFPDVHRWHKHRSGWIDACDRMEQTLLALSQRRQ